MTTFHDLPAVVGYPDLRWVGSMLMDEEQFRVEQWSQRNGEWQVSIPGIHAYAKLRADRRNDRRQSWAERNEADDEASDYYASLADAKPDYGKGK